MADPQVPSIAPVTQAAPGPGEDISAILNQVSQQVQKPLPSQYVQGTSVAQPRVQPVQQYQPKDENNQPLNNQATSLKMARTKNAFAELANVVGKAGQQLQQKKQDLLKEDLKTVMTAKENIANAQVILQQDPQNKMAQGVLDANKKQLEAILTDPKKQKQLSKALDISFTDMDKNKTPEVKAYQDAAKEFKAAGPFTSNNPAEHAVSLQALSAGGSQQPGSQQQQPQAQQQPKTPHADAALAKDLPNVQANPQYAVAQKQQEDAQKQLTQYVIPRLITAEAQKQVQAVKDGNAAARLEFSKAQDFVRESARIEAAAKLEDTKAKAAMQLQIRRDADAMSRTMLNVNARLKVAEMEQIPKEEKAKMQAESLGLVDKDIATVTKTKLDLDKALVDAQNQKDDVRVKQIEMMQNYTDLHLSTLNAFRQEKAVGIYGRVSEGRDGRSGGGGSTKKVAGADLSDEPEDDDSDDY